MTGWFGTGAPPGKRPGWPARLGPLAGDGGSVTVRPLLRRDGRPWREIRMRDEALIARWDASSPLTWAERHSPEMWRAQRTLLARAGRRGDALPFAICVDGAFAGQITLGGIQRGALQSGWVGYWVDSLRQGHGVATRAVALVVAHAFGPVGLHRVEATIAPDNAASMAVVGHVGFRQEGLLARYLDIDGAWRDHLLYAITVEELPAGPDVAATLIARAGGERGAEGG